MKLVRNQAEDESGEILKPQEVRRLVVEYVAEDMLPLGIASFSKTCQQDPCCD